MAGYWPRTYGKSPSPVRVDPPAQGTHHTFPDHIDRHGKGHWIDKEVSRASVDPAASGTAGLQRERLTSRK
jgi:hypothetical protein